MAGAFTGFSRSASSSWDANQQWWLESAQAIVMSAGRMGMRGRGRPVAALTAAGEEEMVGGSPMPLAPYVRPNFLLEAHRHDVRFIFVEVRQHPLFADWLKTLDG